jgi:hypothetical protein
MNQPAQLQKSLALLSRLESALKAPNLSPEAKRRLAALVRKQKAVVQMSLRLARAKRRVQ